jgi:hypothetical protein
MSTQRMKLKRIPTWMITVGVSQGVSSGSTDHISVGCLSGGGTDTGSFLEMKWVSTRRITEVSYQFSG